MIQIRLLKNCPEVIPTLVEWVYQEWRSYDSSLTREKLFDKFNKRLNEDRIPLAFVAFKDGVPVGTITLKENDEPDLSVNSHGSPWLGTLQVKEEERNKGVAQELLKEAKACAVGLGYQEIFTYTSNLDNVEWYLKRGAVIVKTLSFRNHTVTVLKIVL